MSSLWKSVHWMCVWMTCVAAAGARASAQATPVATTDQLPSLERPIAYGGAPLSLNDAIGEALSNNATLVAMRREWDAIRQRPEQARSLAPPTLSTQVWQWPINTLNPSNVNMFMFMIDQELPGRGKRDLRAAVAARDADLASADIAVAARQIVTDLKQAYATLLVARKAADLYRESAGILRQVADASELAYASGRLQQSDVLKPAAALSKLYDEAIVSRNDGELAAAQLNALMGRPVEAAIGALDEPALSWTPPSLDDLLQLSMDHQPELQAARVSVDRAKAEIAVAKSDLKPDFTVQGGYMLMPQGTDAWTAQVGITWPSAPWSRGRADARVAETSAAVSAAEARRIEVESSLKLAVHRALLKTTSARQRATLLQTTVVPQSRQALEVARAGYETGRTPLLAVLESQHALLGEELDYARALADLADARAELERAVGLELGSPAAAIALASKAGGGR